VLLSQVISVKPGAATPFVIVDAAMNDLLRPSLYDAWHGIDAVTPRGGTMKADVVGPICESGDTFAKDRILDQVQAGDLVIFRTAGAYGATMASTYNSRPLTPEVIVDGDRWALVRERREVEDLLPETLPPWLSG
jgi:diaminopimelate decarboxylase